MSDIPSTIIHLSQTASEKDICSCLRHSARKFQGLHQAISIEYASSIVTPSTIAGLMILKESTHLPIRFLQSNPRLKKLLQQLNLMEQFEGADPSSSQPSDCKALEQAQADLSKGNPTRHQFWT